MRLRHMPGSFLGEGPGKLLNFESVPPISPAWGGSDPAHSPEQSTSLDRIPGRGLLLRSEPLQPATEYPRERGGQSTPQTAFLTRLSDFVPKNEQVQV